MIRQYWCSFHCIPQGIFDHWTASSIFEQLVFQCLAQVWVLFVKVDPAQVMDQKSLCTATIPHKPPTSLPPTNPLKLADLHQCPVFGFGCPVFGQLPSMSAARPSCICDYCKAVCTSGTALQDWAASYLYHCLHYFILVMESIGLKP